MRRCKNMSQQEISDKFSNKNFYLTKVESSNYKKIILGGKKRWTLGNYDNQLSNFHVIVCSRNIGCISDLHSHNIQFFFAFDFCFRSGHRFVAESHVDDKVPSVLWYHVFQV